MPNLYPRFLAVLLLLPFPALFAQQLTGVYRGHLGRQKAEVKFIVQGDSIRGTAYYYGLGSGYRRYSIKGYRDGYTNAITWWDDQLLETKGGLVPGAPGKTALASVADFNCPGGGKAMLDGKSTPVEETEKQSGLHLDKVARTQFPDEWDFVIDNFLVGGNDPELIDSIAQVAFRPRTKEEKPEPAVAVARPPKKGMVSIPPPPSEPMATEKPAPPQKPLTIEEKFIARTPKFVMDIPVLGDSVELRFYDNAEIDGDSISLFLNKQLIFQHVRLTAKAHTIKLAVTDLQESNELVMVAENLGRIPPNTSYMVALVGEKRYEANLQSTEETSALIRLVKPDAGTSP